MGTHITLSFTVVNCNWSRMSLANRIIDRADPHSHYVQFYKADEPLLNRNVGYFLWEGFLRGEALLVIATRQRQRSLLDNLERVGLDVPSARNTGQLVCLDAEEMLGRIMVDGAPDRYLFERAVNEELRRVHSPGLAGSVRAYGEMVGVLWEMGRFDAAIALEEYWNKVLHVTGITLFCGYPIDVFSEDLQSVRMQAVLCNHTHLMPTGSDADLDTAVHKAIHEVLGPEAELLRRRMLVEDCGQPAQLLPAEAAIFWLRKNLPDRAADILSRARDHYAACAA
jgi:hypothetical protein